LFVDDKLVIDNWTRQRRGDSFFGSGSKEERGRVHLRAGHAARLRIEFNNVRGPADGDEDMSVMDSNPGVQLGGAIVEDPGAAIDEAVQAAKEADVVIAVVGLNAQWETEGNDRYTLALPGRTDELVEKVAAANPKTIVVVQAVCSYSLIPWAMSHCSTLLQGSAVTMPWAEKVQSIVQAWYLGNATGDAIADVLTGKVNPSGKLSMTFPKRLEDIPAHGHFNSEHGVVRFCEGCEDMKY
jgi:beta-glucosidase